MINPTLDYHHEMVEFVKTAYHEYNINYFALGRVYRDGRLYALHSNPDWSIDHLVKNKFPPAGLANFDALEEQQLVFRSENYDQKLGWTEGAYLTAKEKYQIQNPLIYFNKKADYVDQYFIDLHHPNVTEIYLNQRQNIDEIFKVIKYQFKDLIAKAAKNPLIFDHKIVKNHGHAQEHLLHHKGQLIKLSLREYACLTYLAKGARLKDIALQLKISPRTVETHINRIKTKLNIFTTQELILCYWNNKEFSCE